MKWTLHAIEQFAQLAPAWDDINFASGGLPFLHSRFIDPLCRIFGDAPLQIAVCGEHDPVAMAILTRKGYGRWETFQPSQLPLGAWVMRPGQDYEALLRSLAKALPGAVMTVGVTQQDPDCAQRPLDSRHVQTLDYIKTARVVVDGPFDDYWLKRGKNLRHNTKRQRAKLRQDGVIARLETLTKPEDVRQAIEDYGRLESAGWKADGGTAVHPDNAQGQFYRTMLEAFSRAGAARIYRYRLGEHVASIDLCIEGGGALVILKTTYDESLKGISPAFLMREEAFRDIFTEQKVSRIEFFGKLLEWHTRWTDDARTLYHLTYYRIALLSRLRKIALRLPAARPSS